MPRAASRRANGPPTAPRGRRLGAALAAILLFVALLLLLRGPLLRSAARFLTVQDPLEHADAILMFAGDIDARPPLTAELFRQGLAPRVVLVRPEDRAAQRLADVPNESELARRVLIRLGVPDSAITIVPADTPATSTREEASVFAAYVERTGMQRVIAVTSAYHTRRSRWALRRALESDSVRVMMAPAEHEGFDETNWWRSEDGLLAYVIEYLKLIHNRLDR